MLTPVYITGISAFSTVYMKLFIQSALVKTQRVNIRIYYDRKNNQFVNYIYIYRVSHAEWTKFRESVPYVKMYRYNPKHLYAKLTGYGDNGKRSLKL